MSFEIVTTRDLAHLGGVKICVHGRAGAGKTWIIQTLPNPLVLSAESGMLTLRELDLHAVLIDSIDRLYAVYQWLSQGRDEWQYKSVALDSISEIAEGCLVQNKAQSKDGRRAYGEMNDEMTKLIKLFRDLPGRHVYFSAKQGYNQDEVTGVSRYGPDMPGRTLTQNMPYLFDEVFSLEIGTDPNTGQHFRYLRTSHDLQYECKDRSGVLEPYEEPHLGRIIDKIMSAAA